MGGLLSFGTQGRPKAHELRLLHKLPKYYTKDIKPKRLEYLATCAIDLIESIAYRYIK